MTPDEQQAPRFIARHAVALRAADRRELHRQMLERIRERHAVVAIEDAAAAGAVHTAIARAHARQQTLQRVLKVVAGREDHAPMIVR